MKEFTTQERREIKVKMMEVIGGCQNATVRVIDRAMGKRGVSVTARGKEKVEICAMESKKNENNQLERFNLTTSLEPTIIS